MSAKHETMPRGLRAVHQEGRLSLFYRHHRVVGLILFLAGLFWTVMLAPAYRVLAGGGQFALGEAIAFLPFLLFATLLSYVGLAKMLNESEIRFSPEAIEVFHRPLPWFGAVRLDTAAVKGFQVKRDLKPRDVRHRVTLALAADLANGKQIPLLRAISDAKAARKMHALATAYLEELRARDSGPA